MKFHEARLTWLCSCLSLLSVYQISQILEHVIFINSVCKVEEFCCPEKSGKRKKIPTTPLTPGFRPQWRRPHPCRPAIARMRLEPPSPAPFPSSPSRSLSLFLSFSLGLSSLFPELECRHLVGMQSSSIPPLSNTTLAMTGHR